MFTRLYGSQHTSEVSDTKENECEVQWETLDAGEELELYIQKLKTPVPLPAQTSLFNVFKKEFKFFEIFRTLTDKSEKIKKNH